MSEENMIEKKIKKKKEPKVPKAEKKSRKRGINILDILIILSLVAAVVLVVLVYSPAELFNVNSGNTDIIYSVCISGVPADYAGAVNVGDLVSDIDGYELGTVASDVEVEPHIIYRYSEYEDGSGSINEIVHPELVDIVITVSAKAKNAEDGYTVDGMRIALEAEYQLVFPGFESKGICVSLSEENTSDAGASK